MKWLIRTTIALGLLACLGYASYAFGMFVLSKKLFGDTVLQNSVADASSRSATVTKSVTRKSRDKNAQAGAEVNILDARDAGPGPQAPSLDTLERETRARDYAAPRAPSRQRIVTAESLKTIAPKNDSAISDSTSSNEDRPRKRRRRRHRRTTTETTTNSTTARNDATTTSDSPAPPSDASTRDTSSSSTSSSSRDSSSSGSSERPRRRDSSSDSGNSSRREKRIESPVPGGGAKSDSGSSGGDSPVPVPE